VAVGSIPLVLADSTSARRPSCASGAWSGGSVLLGDCTFSFFFSLILNEPLHYARGFGTTRIGTGRWERIPICDDAFTYNGIGNVICFDIRYIPASVSIGPGLPPQTQTRPTSCALRRLSACSTAGQQCPPDPQGTHAGQETDDCRHPSGDRPA